MQRQLAWLTVGLFAGAVSGFAGGIPPKGGPVPDPPSICDAIAGNLVSNCGFESGITDWTFTPAASGSDFLIVNNAAQANSGNGSVAFGATGSFDDSLSQTITDTPGTVDLEFYLWHLESDVENDFNVYWDGTLVYGIVNTDAFPYTLIDTIPDLVATGSDTLEFAGREVPSYYYLDDVSVVQIVPEPATIFLLGAGLIGAGLIRFKQRAK